MRFPRSFRRDHSGLTTLDQVLILAITAIVALAIYVFAQRLIEWLNVILEGNM